MSAAVDVGGNFRKLPPFRWTGRTTAIASLVAADSLSDAEIAARHGVTDRQIRNWKHHPEFQARVSEHVAELEAATLRYEIAKRRRRVAALDDRWHRMQRVIEARAEAHKDAAPGGETGLLVRQTKMVGYGESAQLIEEWAVDAGLLRELRATEEQAAKELGQWTEKHEQSGTASLRVTFAIERSGTAVAPSTLLTHEQEGADGDG